jgi:hypothetical protein
MRLLVLRSTQVVRYVFLATGLLAISANPAPSDDPKVKYVYVENAGRWVGVVRGDAYFIGKLDKNGDFIHEYKLRVGQPSSFIPDHDLITFTGSTTKPKKVYEYRSGMLIPGELRPDGRFAFGRFVPEAGGKIIPFNDYEYSPTAPPIWNLPGVFVTEEEAVKLKNRKLEKEK